MRPRAIAGKGEIMQTGKVVAIGFYLKNGRRPRCRLQRAVGCYDFTLATQNLITPLTYWNVMGTRLFDSGGNFIISHAIGRQGPPQFCEIQIR